ncbi:hypothetical protein J7K91_02415 [bacterium]|nr:hypothetical protein [bacterium]
MKKVGAILAIFVILVFSTFAYAQSSSATASSNAAAAAVMNAAPSSSASASIENISPSSSVRIETKAKSIYKNRQFLHPMGVGIPSPMQPFLAPRQLSPAIWNFLPVIEGKWKKENEMKKIEVLEYKEHIYKTFPAVDKVRVVSNSRVRVVGEIVGELILKGTKNTDSRELLMIAIDKLAANGANLVWVRINSIESKAVSHYKGFVVGGSGGGVILYQEKASLVGGTGIGRGTTTLEFHHFPVLQAIGYRAAKIEKIISEKTEEEKEKIGNHRKEYEIIRNN